MSKDQKKQWTELELISVFLLNYHEKFNDDRRGIFGIFRQRNLQWQDYKTITLEKIFAHALHPEHGTGARTLGVLVDLGWITADGKVNPLWAMKNDAPDISVVLNNIDQLFNSHNVI